MKKLNLTLNEEKQLNSIITIFKLANFKLIDKQIHKYVYTNSDTQFESIETIRDIEYLFKNKNYSITFKYDIKNKGKCEIYFYVTDVLNILNYVCFASNKFNNIDNFLKKIEEFLISLQIFIKDCNNYNRGNNVKK